MLNRHLAANNNGKQHHDSDTDDNTNASGSTEESVFLNGSNRSVFKKARKLIKSGPLFRFVTHVFAERKLVLAFLVHFVCTMIIWVHFALIKFREQETKVPEGANRYWWKRIIPPLEFGSMHAILFQMSLLPLTMSRLSIASASSSFLNDYVPFNRMIRIHIHLGYTMVLIVFLATIFFFAFFGMLCTDGEKVFCDKFTVEIMITGYCIFGFLILIGVTSYVREVIPYEIFYIVHHLVFLMYIVTTLHTFDSVQRNDERERSQTFKWYSATLLYYCCDRAAMYMNHRYITTVAASSAVTSSKGTRMVIIKLHRPTLFKFKPGQYAYIRITQIDTRYWHPFSIASGPESDYLEFYMEVYGVKSWTNKLWNLIEKVNDPDPLSRRDLYYRSDKLIGVEVKGPYGTSLGDTANFSHAVAIGSGTGVVPMLSLFKQHIRQLLRLDPQLYIREKNLRNEKINNLYESQDLKRGSICSKIMPNMKRHNNERLKSAVVKMSTSPRGPAAGVAITRPIGGDRRRSTLSVNIKQLSQLQLCEHDRLTSIKDIVRESRKGRRPIYRGCFLLLLPVLGVIMLGFTISWNTIPIELYGGMDTCLIVGTVVFQVLFMVTCLTVHDRSHFLTFVDVALTIISAFTDWYWFAKNKWANMDISDLVFYAMTVGYMTLRLWSTVAHASSIESWRKEASTDGFIVMDKMSFIWVTRSAHLVSEIMPDIVDIWDTLCTAWGTQLAREVCDIAVYVTDKDTEACDALRNEMYGLSLERCISFTRPNFDVLIENHALERIDDETCIHSNTLLAFCGSPNLSRHIGRVKIATDVSKLITGNKLHQCEYVSESYGTSKASSSSSRRTALYSINNKGYGKRHDTNNSRQRPALTTRSSFVYRPSQTIREEEEESEYRPQTIKEEEDSESTASSNRALI